MSGELKVSQLHHINKIISKFGMSDPNSVIAPLDPGTKLLKRSSAYIHEGSCIMPWFWRFFSKSSETYYFPLSERKNLILLPVCVWTYCLKTLNFSNVLDLNLKKYTFRKLIVLSSFLIILLGDTLYKDLECLKFRKIKQKQISYFSRQ